MISPGPFQPLNFCEFTVYHEVTQVHVLRPALFNMFISVLENRGYWTVAKFPDNAKLFQTVQPKADSEELENDLT